MEPDTDLTQTVPPDWKWQALFASELPFGQQWRTWLADAQKAEEQSLLSYWAQRRPADDQSEDRLAA